MRTDGYYFFHFISFEDLNNLQCLHLVEHFIAGTPCRIAGTGLFLPRTA